LWHSAGRTCTPLTLPRTALLPNRRASPFPRRYRVPFHL
jgi:hypothetical protein